MNKNMKVVKPVEKYKPGYLGKVMPVDNPSKLTDFVTNKYDAFSMYVKINLIVLMI